jgi:hypothetical protein
MKRFITIGTLVFLMIAARNVTGAEIKVFDIKLAGIKIGELTAQREVKDSFVYYSLESKVSFWFFSTIKVHHQNNSVYCRGRLVSSQSTSSTNKGNFSSSIVWNKTYYAVKVSSYKYENEAPIHKHIHFNIARFYFDAPEDVTEVLADGYGVLSSVKKKDASTFEADVLGNKNKYYYDKGLLISATMHSKIKNYEIVLRKDEH